MQTINPAYVSSLVFLRPFSAQGSARTQSSRLPGAPGFGNFPGASTGLRAGVDGAPALTGARAKLSPAAAPGLTPARPATASASAQPQAGAAPGQDGAPGAGRAQGGEDGRPGKTAGDARQDPRSGDQRDDPSRPRGADGEALTDRELKELTQLKRRDREVKAHERAHLAAARGLARGGAQFSYQVGADGHRYAVGGEVSIDTSAENDPRATVSKMETVRRAALAPSNPSGQDRRVAAVAAGREAAARRDLAVERREQASQGSEDANDAPAADKQEPAGSTGGQAMDGAGDARDANGAGNDSSPLTAQSASGRDTSRSDGARASTRAADVRVVSGRESPTAAAATLDLPPAATASSLARAAHAGLQAAGSYGREPPGAAALGRVFTSA